MSITGNQNQPLPPAPLPVDDENGGTNSTPVQKPGLASPPAPNTTTNPLIKNN